MEILTGKRGMVTERDEAILQDLFFAPGLTTNQIATMYFDAYRTAKARLYGLRSKGLLVNMVHKAGAEPGEVFWKLGKRAFEREAEAAGRRGERYRGWPKGRALHLRDTNGLFVEVSYHLDEVLGRFPGWEWVDEPRAAERYEFSGERRQHQPDAEVRFGGLRFFVERESRRAKETPEAFGRKMVGYRGYVAYSGLEGRAQVVFACDTGRDARYALAAGERYGMPVFAGGPEEAAIHLVEQARRATAAAGPR